MLKVQVKIFTFNTFQRYINYIQKLTLTFHKILKQAHMQRFIFLDHTADVKFQAFGKTLEECFENSARAMFAVMQSGKPSGKTTEKSIIRVSGKDLPALLYNFLEEFIFLMDTEDFFLKEIKVKILEKRKKIVHYHLEAEIVGVKASEQDISIVVKAVTYHEMFVKEAGIGREKKWIAQVVVDV